MTNPGGIMSDVTIPEDIREEAIIALDAYRNATGAGLLVAFEDQVGAVATGILAERKRCADIVEAISVELASIEGLDPDEAEEAIACSVEVGRAAKAIRSSS